MNSKQSKLKQVVALLTAVVVALTGTPMTAYADRVGPHGNGGGSGTQNGGVFQMPGVVVTIGTIKNTKALKKKYEDQNKSVKDDFGPVGVATYDTYYNTFPKLVTDGARATKSSVLITRDSDGRMSTKNGKNFFVFGGNKSTTNTFSHIYETTRDVGSQPYRTCGLGKDLNASDKWKDQTMTEKELDKIVSKVTSSEWKTAINSFVKMFGDTGKVNANYEEFITKGTSKVNEANYMEMLIVLNRMSGNAHKDKINGYLKERNGEDCKKFIIVEAISVASVRDSGRNGFWWYSYPTYMATMYKGAQTKRV